MPLHGADLIDAAVENGTTVTYQWVVNENNGPAELDLSTVAYKYGSNEKANPVGNLFAGLFGVAIIARGVILSYLILRPVIASDIPFNLEAFLLLFPFLGNGIPRSTLCGLDNNRWYYKKYRNRQAKTTLNKALFLSTQVTD